MLNSKKSKNIKSKSRSKNQGTTMMSPNAPQTKLQTKISISNIDPNTWDFSSKRNNSLNHNDNKVYPNPPPEIQEINIRDTPPPSITIGVPLDKNWKNPNSIHPYPGYQINYPYGKEAIDPNNKIEVVEYGKEMAKMNNPPQPGEKEEIEELNQTKIEDLKRKEELEKKNPKISNHPGGGGGNGQTSHSSQKISKHDDAIIYNTEVNLFGKDYADLNRIMRNKYGRNYDKRRMLRKDRLRLYQAKRKNENCCERCCGSCVECCCQKTPQGKWECHCNCHCNGENENSCCFCCQDCLGECDCFKNCCEGCKHLCGCLKGIICFDSLECNQHFEKCCGFCAKASETFCKSICSPFKYILDFTCKSCEFLCKSACGCKYICQFTKNCFSCVTDTICKGCLKDCCNGCSDVLKGCCESCNCNCLKDCCNSWNCKGCCSCNCCNEKDCDECSNLVGKILLILICCPCYATFYILASALKN